MRILPYLSSAVSHCSTALQTSSIWANTIGLQEEQKGTNQAIEASIYAPGGGGRGREAKRQRAQELIEASEQGMQQLR
jgi:hypothetical protein